MNGDRSTVNRKPLRADARRNRDAILQAAREVFDLQGVLAPLDMIALRAGVGNATLYRNFATREDLLSAVMNSDLDEAKAVATRLVADLGPRQALAEWLQWLTWRLRIWHDLPHCVAEAAGEQEGSTNPAVSLLMQLTNDLLEVARATGDAVSSVDAREVFELVIAVSWAVDRFGDLEDLARRRVEVAIAGIFARSS